MSNTKAVKFNKMIYDKTNDELGLFEKYDDVLYEIQQRIFNYNASSIVDIGCGTCNLCGELSDSLDVIGIDNNLDMLSYSSNKFKNMKLKLGNFLDKPFKRNFADIVVSTYAFHILNTEEKEKALNNMLGYLKNNGRIIIADFMFYNNLEKEKCKSLLYEKNRKDLVDFIESKHYTNLDEFTNYIKSLGLTFSIDHIINFTWILEITFK